MGRVDESLESGEVVRRVNKNLKSGSKVLYSETRIKVPL